MDRWDRRWMSIILSVCVAVTGLLMVGSAGAAEPAATPLPAPDLRDVTLIGQAGWAVGENGTILTTTDGGATWTAQASAHAGWLFGVAGTDAAHAWAVGGAHGATVLGTSDGGATWAAQATTTGSLQAVAAMDATHAWAVGSYGSAAQIVATNDGAAWSKETLPVDAGPLLDVCAADASHVWAVGNGGTIVATTDGGSAWALQHADKDITLTAVSFIDALHGWAAGYAGSGIFATRAVLLATADGGATWTEIHRAASQSYFTDIVRQDQLHGWAVGSYGAVPRAVFRTSDGGATWTLSAIAASPLAAVALSGSGVCVVGDAAFTRVVEESSDATAPVSTVTGASMGWRTRWVLRLSATEMGGSGVALRQFSVGGQRRWQGAGSRLILASAGDHAFDGAHRVYYRSGDAAGNVEAARFVTIHIDTRPPTTTALRHIEARSGGIVRLRYLVGDPKPCAGWARVKAAFVAGDADGGEHIVKQLRLGRVSVGTWHVTRFHCTLPPGLYVVAIQARDAAGNLGGGNCTILHVN
jgi:photosystem II stability/assembly factor-like uncharacterized protein